MRVQFLQLVHELGSSSLRVYAQQAQKDIFLLIGSFFLSIVFLIEILYVSFMGLFFFYLETFPQAKHTNELLMPP